MTKNCVKIGIANHSDIESLVKLLGLLFEQEDEFRPNPTLQQVGLNMIIENPQHGEIIVLRNDDEVIGMVSLLYTISTALGGRVALLEDMVVLPQFRNQGFGEQLLAAARNRAIKTGCQRVTLLSDANNQSAHDFYQRHGFRPSQMKPFRISLSTADI